MVFLSGFQKANTPKNALLVSNLGNVKSIFQINTEITTRNNPGTFNATLFHTSKNLMLPDEPEVEIAQLYKQSTSKQTIDLGADAERTSTGKKLSNYSNIANAEEGNFYKTPSFTSWKESLNLVLEDQESGIRYPLLILDSTTGSSEYWTFDIDGNIYNFSQSEIDAVTDGGEITFKTRRFLLFKKPNSLFTDLYKDINAHGNNPTLFNNGRCRIQSMDKVAIFATERFTPANTQPKLIKIFTGVVNNVEDSYAEGKATINISGEDVTKYMKISLININPSLQVNNTSDVLETSDQQITIWSDIFKGMTAVDIVKACTIGMKRGEKLSDGRKNDLPYDIAGIGDYLLQSDFKNLKQIKFSKDENTFVEIEPIGGKNTKISFQQVLQNLFKSSTVHICDPYSKNQKLFGFRPYEISLQNSWSFYQGDWKTRREIAYRAAEDCHFVFYADRNGELWFQPPRFSNSWILGASNPDVYIIDTPSIISYGFVESDENIFTAVYMSTEPPFGMDGAQSLGLYSKSFVDEGAILKYGFRVFTGSNPVINIADKKGSSGGDFTLALNEKGEKSIIIFAKSLLQRLLAQKYQGQITILGRAELDPNRPVYIPYRNQIYYVETVSHQISFGGQFTTTLHLSYGRKPWEQLPELMTMSTSDDVYLTDGNIFTATEKVTSSEVRERKTPVKKKSIKSAGKNLTPQQNLLNVKNDLLHPIEVATGLILTITDSISPRLKTNAHPKGEAIDVVCTTVPDIRELYERIKEAVRITGITFDQIIYERDHVHMSYISSGRRENRNEFLLELTEGKYTADLS